MKERKKKERKKKERENKERKRKERKRKETEHKGFFFFTQYQRHWPQPLNLSSPHLNPFIIYFSAP